MSFIISDKSTKYWIATFFILAFVIRLTFGVITYHNNGSSSYVDAWDYIGLAEEFIHGHFMEYDTEILPREADVKDIMHDRIGPGLPLIISPFLAVSGSNYLPIIIFNALLESIAVVMLFLLASECFSRKVGILSSFWLIFYWYHIQLVPWVLKEPLLILLVLLTLYFFFKGIRQNKIVPLIWLVFSYGYLIHTDERFLFFLPVLIFGFLYLSDFSLKIKIKQILLFGLFLILFMGPWFIRNYMKYDRPVLLTTRLQDRIDVFLNIRSKDALYSWGTQQVRIPLTSQEKWERKEKSEAELQYIDKIRKPYPYTGFEKISKNVIEHWRFFRFETGYFAYGYRFRAPWTLRANILTFFQWGLPLLLCIISVFFAIRQRNRFALFFLLFLFAHLILHSGLIVFGLWRYRTTIDPLVILLASYCLFELLEISGLSRKLERFVQIQEPNPTN